MDYLQRIKEEKIIKEQYEQDQLRLKVIHKKIKDIHEAKDGEFLNKMEQFLSSCEKEYKLQLNT